jgi:hypothetical protein
MEKQLSKRQATILAREFRLVRMKTLSDNNLKLARENQVLKERVASLRARIDSLININSRRAFKTNHKLYQWERK